MIARGGSILLGLLVMIAAAPQVALHAQVALPGGLESGPHAVGFRILTTEDASRPTGGRVASGTRTDRRARPLRIHIWYPAAAAGSARLTIADYARAASLPEPQHRQDVARMMAFPMTDEEWTGYLAHGLTATRDAAPAAGRYPLVVGMLRGVSVAVTGEHLASHGYVVAYVERQAREDLLADGLVREALIMNEHMRDLQIAVARMREQPNVDPVRLGAQGFSGDGLAQLVLAMRHPDVDAVSLLETGWLSPAQVSSYQEVAAYDPLAMRTALFYAYSENLGRNSLEHIAELTGMRYGTRSLLYLGEPQMTHLDFATEGLVLSERLPRRAATRPAIARMAQAAFHYQRIFFDAHIKGDQAARLRLSDVPVPRSGGALVELTVLPAITPAIGRADWRALFDKDMAAGMERARADLKGDPRAPVFDAAWLNTIAFEYAQRNQRDRALAILELATEAHPASANLLDSLSEIQEVAGLRTEARASAERALAALPRDSTVPPAQRAALEAGLKARLKRVQ